MYCWKSNADNGRTIKKKKIEAKVIYPVESSTKTHSGVDTKDQKKALSI